MLQRELENCQLKKKPIFVNDEKKRTPFVIHLVMLFEIRNSSHHVINVK